MKMKSNLIGFIMMIVGMFVFVFTESLLCMILILPGVFLFASFLDEDIFVDYVMVDSNDFLIRKRKYILFFPFIIISKLLTLGKAELKLVCKEEYFKTIKSDTEEKETIRISRKEYITLRNEQRQLYATQPFSKEFMQANYSVEGIGFKRKKRRLIIVSALAILGLTMFAGVDPASISLDLMYEALFITMIILWTPEYKDAKILQEAYERALGEK